MDEDELEEALESGGIGQKMYNLAWNEANRITSLIREQKFHFSEAHKELLEAKLPKEGNGYA